MCLYRHSKLSELLLPKSCTDTTRCLWCSKSNFVWLWLPTSFSDEMKYYNKPIARRTGAHQQLHLMRCTTNPHGRRLSHCTVLVLVTTNACAHDIPSTQENLLKPIKQDETLCTMYAKQPWHIRCNCQHTPRTRPVANAFFTKYEALFGKLFHQFGHLAAAFHRVHAAFSFQIFKKVESLLQ